MSSVASNVSFEAKSPQSLPNFFDSSSVGDGILMVGAVTGLAITSIQYARWLNTPLGKKWDQQHTWFVTVLGVMLTLAWLAIHDPKAAIKAFGFFMISGMPIVVRALDGQSAVLETYIQHEKQQSDH
jgi:hypothetical protein